MNTSIDAASRAKLVANLKKAVDKVQAERGQCNIFLCGPTGAGKSSLVNAVFGENFAETGVGQSVTQGFHKYAKPGSAVCIHDVQGIEHRDDEEYKRFLQSQVDYFEETNSKLDYRDHIHLIWFICNAQTARIESHIATVVNAFVKKAGDLSQLRIRNAVLDPVPVFLVLNKSECLSPAEREVMIQSCVDLNINIPTSDMFTVSADRISALNSLKVCPACGSPIIKDNDDQVFICKDRTHVECQYADEEGAQSKQYFTEGVSTLILASKDRLPDEQRRAFVIAQQVAVKEKQQLALSIIRQYSDLPTAGLTFLFGTTKDRDTERSEMIAKLCDVWQLTGEASESTSMAMAVMVSEYIPSVIGTVLPVPFLSERTPDVVNKTFYLPFVGLTVNRCLRDAYVAALSDAYGEGSADVTPKEATVQEQMMEIWGEYKSMQCMGDYLDSMLDIPHLQLPSSSDQGGVRRRTRATSGAGSTTVHDGSDLSPAPPVGASPKRSSKEAAVGATVLISMLLGIWFFSSGWFPKLVATVMCVVSCYFILFPYTWEEEEEENNAGAGRSGVDQVVDSIMDSRYMSMMGIDVRRPLKVYLANELSGLSKNVASSIQESAESSMRANYYPGWLIKRLSSAVQKLCTDAAAATIDAGLDVETAPRAEPYRGRFAALRRLVLYRLFPYDRPFWKKIEDPLWWTFSCIATFPIWGVRELCWFCIYFWLDKTDPYQVINAIVSFKGLHFLTLGMLQLGAGAAKYFMCANTMESYCHEKGPSLEYYEVFGFIAQLTVMVDALKTLRSLPATRGMKEAHTSHRDGTLFWFLKMDLIFAVIIFSACCSSMCFGERITYGLEDTKWQVKAIFFWGRVIYGILSIPFLIYKIPFFLRLLTHARKTGYDTNGNLQFSTH